jgi:SOUL heme-binding protein
VIVLLVWMVFCAWVLAGWLAAQSIQSPPYERIRSAEGYEIRAYDQLLAAQVSVAGPWSAALARGVPLLAAYLGGENTTQESIALNRPIGMEPEGESIADAVPVLQQEKNGAWLISFVLPPQWTDVTVPRPNNPTVRIVRLPARTVAVVSFSGRMTQSDAGRHEQELRELLLRDRVVIVGPATAAQYHLPWAPPFLRHNEIMIPIR